MEEDRQWKVIIPEVEMILKIKDFVQGKIKWWFFDNIDHVQVFGTSIIKYDSDGKQDAKFAYNVIVIIPYEDRRQGEDGVEYKKICCTKHDGSEFSVVFSTFAFLCNDQGKTIERINVCDDAIEDNGQLSD